MLRVSILAAVLVVGGMVAAQAAERRCGWYINPTPGNLWLADRDATWSITSQMEAAGPDAQGADDKAPNFDAKQFVDTKGGAGYGHGCACLTVDTDTASRRITRVYAGSILPLSVCKADKTLPNPDQG